MTRVERFLKESNGIEGVYDQDSLKQAMYAWDYLIKEKELNPSVVLKTHKILMLNQPLLPNERGYFRKRPIYIGNKEGMYYPEINEAMKTWCYNAWLFPQE